MTRLNYRSNNSKSTNLSVKNQKPYSVIFINEEDDHEEDKENLKKPLIKSTSKSKLKSPYSEDNNVKSILRKRFHDFNRAVHFPQSFKDYLISENSILTRLISSMFPPLFISRFKRISVDFEGTFLSIFLLSSTIYYGLVTNVATTNATTTLHGKPIGNKLFFNSRLHSLGFSVALSFGYVSIISGLVWGKSKLTRTCITFRQIICVIGYGLFGHALTLLICELISDTWFIPLLILFGGLDSSRIALILFSRTRIPAFRFVICTPIMIVHLLYLVYLHFAIMKD